MKFGEFMATFVIGFIIGAWMACENGLPEFMKCGSRFWCGGALNPCGANSMRGASDERSSDGGGCDQRRDGDQ